MRPKSSNTLSWFFEENERKRTQELFCGGLPTADSFREIVRQQLNFSPPETVREAPEYQVELSGVTVLELTIIPEISGGTASASLKNLRVA
jgi:hypothetical protein